MGKEENGPVGSSESTPTQQLWLTQARQSPSRPRRGAAARKVGTPQPVPRKPGLCGLLRPQPV